MKTALVSMKVYRHVFLQLNVLLSISGLSKLFCWWGFVVALCLCQSEACVIDK
jgi:hypothetical protein